MRRERTRRRLVLAALAAASVGLMAVDAGDEPHPATSAARHAAAAAFAPVSDAASAVFRPVTDAAAAIAAAPGAKRRIDELEQRNSELSAELAARDLDDRRSRDLEELLQLSGLGGYEVLPARSVTRVGTGGYADAVTLDVGTRDGVRPNMTVVDGGGLVGRVVRAAERTSTVLLISDGASSVGVRMEGTGQIGVVHGRSHPLDSDAPAELELMRADAKIAEGDRIVTMGSHDGAPFVPGVPVGTVTEVRDTPGALTRTAEVRPAVDLGALDIVGVVLAAPEEDPRDAVLPSEPPSDAGRSPKGEQG
ncbi:rod shape-determining protein MreC [Nocardiopsis composta]|uniref:Cell shape-determining protein MreC n=1 Tax=Nocardiopsis composta TaxID=157465 RepID=A0A7W8QRI9_9ACTN|nr:rod shape-determining protein MreC [Nocardiopsis composta]MBB5435302.1 rod shape-determining protein MreC [Nocardiopsis composta]